LRLLVQNLEAAWWVPSKGPKALADTQ